MRLCKLSEYRRLFFTPDSAPAMATLRKNILLIPGGQIVGGRYYVDLDLFEQTNNFRSKIEDRQRELAKSSVLQGLL